MFTGLVEQLGRVRSVQDVPFGRVLEIDPAGWGPVSEAGASIAVNGCCLTVTASPAAVTGDLRFEVIRQTLENTTLGGLGAGDPVNLEASVTAATLMGGHIVQGHIDGVGRVERIDAGTEERRVSIAAPEHLRPLIVPRGSIAIDGVSMTVAEIGSDQETFEIALIPTTIEKTTLGGLAVGDRVNLESDCIARMVVHWLEMRAGGLLNG